MFEDELIKRSLQKDESAFLILMNLYQDKIYQHVLGIVKDEMIAQEIKQDTFLHAYQKLATFHQNSSFYTWIYRIAHNKALNALRKKNRMREEIFDEHIAPPLSKNSEWDEEFLTHALEHLSSKHKEVFEMFLIKKMSQKEIASILHVPLGTVRSRLFYAKRHVRSFYKLYDQSS